MVSTRLITVAFMASIVINSGCDKTFANSNAEIKGKETLESTANGMKLRGKFKRSFEIYEIESDGTIYYVSDPKQLLMKYSEKINQNEYYKHFDVCIFGSISSKGSYGPLGKYQQQIKVRGICA